METDLTRRPVSLTLQEQAGVRRISEPVTAGIPFPEGVLKTGSDVRLADGTGGDLPLQTEVLGHWRDGSVKWLLVDFQADLEPNQERTWDLQFGEAGEIPAPPDRIEVVQNETAFIVTNGPLRFEVLREGRGLIRFISIRDPETNAWQSVSQEGVCGRVYAPEVHNGQIRLQREVECFSTVGMAEVLVEGPLRVLIRVKGCHRTEDYEDLLRFQAEIHVYLGQPFLVIDYTIENRIGNYIHPVPDPPDYFYQRLAHPMVETLDLEIALDGAVQGYQLGMEGEVQSGTRVELSQTGPGAWDGGTFEAIVRTFEGEAGETVHTGAQAGGWIVARGESFQAFAGIRDFWQQHPKAIRATARKLSLGLWSPDEGYFVPDRGMAKIHRVLLHFGATDALINASLAFLNHPPRAVVPPEWICGSRR